MSKPGEVLDEHAKEAGDQHRDGWAVFGLLGALTAVAFALPLLAYFWIVHHYGLNVIYADNWDDIRLIAHSFSGSLTFGQLWAVHGENRILFPNLLVLAIAHTTHFNIVAEEYLNAVLLTATTGLLIVTHRRRSPDTPWLYYAPVVFLMLTFVQGHNAIWGFQLSWYLVLASLAVVLLLLDQAHLGRWAFAGAIAAAVVGSYSSLQGLLIWPSALFLLWIRSRTKGCLVVWIIAATVIVGIFFYNFHFQHGDLAYVLRHPIDSIAFYFFIIGDVVGLQAPPDGHVGNLAVAALGAVITGVAVWSVIRYGIRPSLTSPGALGVTTILFGLMCAGLTTIGRASYGPSVALRYAVFTLLVWVGCYLTLLSRPTAEGSRRDRVESLSIIRIIVAFAICLQVVLGTAWGIRDLRNWHQTEFNAGRVTADIPMASDQLVVSALYPNPYVTASYLRGLTNVAEVHRLSLFNTGPLDALRKSGLPVDPVPPMSSIVKPESGSMLNGLVILAATASATSMSGMSILNFGVTEVDFVLEGSDRRSRIIASGVHTSYGWLAKWNSRSVPDGEYIIRSVAHATTSHSGESTPVSIAISN